MFRSRPYAGDTDFAILQQFVIKIRSRWHVGDVTWRMLFDSRFDPAQNVRLWEDENSELVAFAWFYPTHHMDIQTLEPALWPEMIAWGVERMRTYGESDRLRVAAPDAATALITYLQTNGFTFDEAYDYRLACRLDRELPPPVLPDGFTLRTVQGEAEAEQRVKIHHAAFNSDHVTVEGYRSVLRNPAYDPNLDLVIVAPDGRFAAFCLCWIDSQQRIGEVEPLGVHPDFQRQGLGRAIMLEGLRRMQTKGMERTLLSTWIQNDRALNLYKSLGFEIIYTEQAYAKSF